MDVLYKIIKRSCEIKGFVVENDEKESNLRKILNFGHTVGHAVEQLSGYSISHGSAISIGMVIEAQIAAGIQGILACGTTGQSATLSRDEHIHLAEHIYNHTDGRAQSMASPGSHHTREPLDSTTAI